MKIPVYDSVNKERLLGHYSTRDSLESKSLWGYYCGRISPGCTYRSTQRVRVHFEVFVRSESTSVQNDLATRTTTTVEHKVLLTSATLEELRFLKGFEFYHAEREADPTPAELLRRGIGVRHFY